MSERITPRQERARKTADAELDRIKDKYLKGVIPDDGSLDALSYAVSQLECARKMNNKIDIDRWIYAINPVTGLDSPDWTQLRNDIEFDAKGFIEVADTQDWADYGHALFNLADSTPY